MTKSQKHLTVAVLAGFVALVVVAILLVLRAAEEHSEAVVPKPGGQTLEQRAAFIASDTFAALPIEQKRDYLHEVRRLRGEGDEHPKLTEKQREKLVETIRGAQREMRGERMKTYFALPETERDQFLDEMIDEMQKRRAERGERRPPPPATDDEGQQEVEGESRGPINHRGPPTLSHFRDRIEGSTPEERAQRMEFRRAMRERMEERGIEPPRPPPPR